MPTTLTVWGSTAEKLCRSYRISLDMYAHLKAENPSFTGEKKKEISKNSI
jgi:hypothetical protein